MSRARKFFGLLLVGVWTIQAVSCNPSSETSTNESAFKCYARLIP